MRNIIKGKGNNMKVIGFVRVSTGHQKLSVSNQIAEIKDYCKKTDGLELVDILQEEAVSGDAVVRVGFDKMIQMIDKKEIILLDACIVGVIDKRAFHARLKNGHRFVAFKKKGNFDINSQNIGDEIKVKFNKDGYWSDRVTSVDYLILGYNFFNSNKIFYQVIMVDFMRFFFSISIL